MLLNTLCVANYSILFIQFVQSFGLPIYELKITSLHSIFQILIWNITEVDNFSEQYWYKYQHKLFVTFSQLYFFKFDYCQMPICETGLSPPLKYFTDRSKAVLLLWILYVFFCLVFAMPLCAPVSMCLGKG